MAVTLRGRRVAYDNIASGSATGKERTIRGDAGTTEAYRGNEIIKLGTTDVAIEDFILTTTDQTNDNVG